MIQYKYITHGRNTFDITDSVETIRTDYVDPRYQEVKRVREREGVTENILYSKGQTKE
jgi:hypothetical protein